MKHAPREFIHISSAGAESPLATLAATLVFFVIPQQKLSYLLSFVFLSPSI
jgi:hypothetical protein